MLNLYLQLSQRVLIFIDLGLQNFSDKAQKWNQGLISFAKDFGLRETFVKILKTGTTSS